MALFDKSNLDKITELAKTVSDKAVEIAKNVGDKTSDMLELGKLNAQIAASKSSVEELKERLGDHYWQKFEKGETLDDDAVVLCNTIKEYMEEIEALKEQVAELKASGSAVILCPNCGAENADDALFCKQCGASLAAEESEEESDETVCEVTTLEADEEVSVICPNCGAENTPDSTFCEKCGTKL